MIYGLDHITIVVSDLKRSIEFYTKNLNFKYESLEHIEGKWIDKINGIKGVSAEVAFLKALSGEVRLELLNFKTPKSEKDKNISLPNAIGIRHIALKVKNINEIVFQFKLNGVKMISDPIEAPKDIKSGDFKSKTLCYFLDPDGILLELAQYV